MIIHDDKEPYCSKETFDALMAYLQSNHDKCVVDRFYIYLSKEDMELNESRLKLTSKIVNIVRIWHCSGLWFLHLSPLINSSDKKINLTFLQKIRLYLTILNIRAFKKNVSLEHNPTDSRIKKFIEEKSSQ